MNLKINETFNFLNDIRLGALIVNDLDAVKV